jgi:carboxypeptidase family protein
MGLRLLRLSSCCVLVFVCLSGELESQTTTGGLTGVVTDQSYAVIPNVEVHIKEAAEGILQSTRTDQRGVYRFFFVVPARYTLTVRITGFALRTEWLLYS